MLYLTGADNSLAKSLNNPQTSIQRSLGGYISSTLVPNSANNVLFDLVSNYTLEKKQNETLAFGLINRFNFDVNDVKVKIISDINSTCNFKIAAIAVDSSNYQMEQISNRYQEPYANFYDATFNRAGANIEILNPGTIGEEIILYPFNVRIEILKEGIDGNWESFMYGFSNNETYQIKRIAENIFRIERKDEKVLTEAIQCSYICSENFTANFSKLENKTSNEVLISEKLIPNQAIGLWIKREIKDDSFSSNEKLFENYKNKYIDNKVEQIEICITYSDYSEDYSEDYFL